MEQEKQLRQQFFAFRNGIVADALRRGGDPHEMIMGCQLADLMTITAGYEQDATLAQSLWNDRRHRECRLVATMLMPPAELSHGQALEWCHSVESTEVADVLCHRLLRRLSYASQLWRELSDSDNTLVQYLAYRLLLNLLLVGKEAKSEALRADVAKRLSASQPPLSALLKDIVDELSSD